MLTNLKRVLRAIKTYRLELISFFAGAVVLTFELTASRVVAPYLGGTIYIWTSIIGSVLAGLAIGYTAGGYLADQRHRVRDIMWLLILAAVLVLAVDLVKDPLLGFVSGTTWPLRLQATLVGVSLFMLPTIVLGALPPYLARLSLVDIKTSGRHIARINAAGTVGSLFGTFITGYVLFGFVGTHSILAMLALCLLIVSFLINHKDAIVMRLALLGLSVLLLMWPPTLQVQTVSVRKDIDTRYGRYVIGDAATFSNRPVRVLQADIFSWESGAYLDGDKSLVFPYAQAFAGIAERAPQNETTLMIGGGTFSVPEYIANQDPSMKVDVVEIDDQLQSISQQYFNFSQPSNLRIIEADGRQFLNKNANAYDLIFLDAFAGSVPPFQLLTVEATKKVEASLSSSGMVVMNVVAPHSGSGAALPAAITDTYQKIFKYVAVYPVQPELGELVNQNLLLLASQKPLPMQLLGLAGLPQVTFDTASYPILTDDYAPVERLHAN